MLYFQLFINKYFLHRITFWNFILIFCHNGFFIRFCLFFDFNLYARSLSYTENYFASFSVLFEWKVPWEFPVAVQWPVFFFLPRVYFILPREFLFYRDLFLFCWEHVSFAVRFFVLRRLSFFCRGNFCFAARFFLFPWRISFLQREFLFCVEFSSFILTYFFFAARIFLLAREFLFCRKLFYFLVTFVGHFCIYQRLMK